MGVSHEEHVPASCPSILSTLLVLASCARSLSPLNVLASCPPFMSPLPVHAHVLASCPRFISPLHVAAPCAWFMSPSVSRPFNVNLGRNQSGKRIRMKFSPTTSVTAMFSESYDNVFFHGIVVRSVFCQECHVDVHNQNTDSSTLFSDSSLSLFCLY